MGERVSGFGIERGRISPGRPLVHSAARVLGALFPKDVVVAAAAVRFPPERTAHEGEEARPHGAGALRVAEFAAGRLCARRVLKGLDLGGANIGMEVDGAAAWPVGIVGALSHSRGLAAAAGVRSGVLVGIGLDLTPIRTLPPDRAALFCLPSELRWLGRRPKRDQALCTLILFAAKESAQKCARPILGCLPSRGDVELHIELEKRRFDACVHGFSGLGLSGRYAMESGYLFVAATARRCH